MLVCVTFAHVTLGLCGREISEEEDGVKYFVSSSTHVGCGCVEAVVDSCSMLLQQLSSRQVTVGKW